MHRILRKYTLNMSTKAMPSPVTKPESTGFRIAWLSLAIVGIATLLFGLVVTLWPGAGDHSSRYSDLLMRKSGTGMPPRSSITRSSA